MKLTFLIFVILSIIVFIMGAPAEEIEQPEPPPTPRPHLPASKIKDLYDKKMPK